MLQTLRRPFNKLHAAGLLLAERGLQGFIQGVFPPLIGSSFYRMAMLSSYEASYTYFSAQDKDGFWHTQIADGWLPRPLVLASALCASVSRSVVESPFEYTKVMRQTDKAWKVNELYRGFGMQVSVELATNSEIFARTHIHTRNRSAVLKLSISYYNASFHNRFLLCKCVCSDRRCARPRCCSTSLGPTT